MRQHFQIIALFLCSWFFGGNVSPLHAQTEITPQAEEALPAHPLAHAQRVHIEGIALTERGLQDPTLLVTTVADRLSQAGYSVAFQADRPHDVVVRIKCEERQTWTGPSKRRSTSPNPTDRLWKGPACHLSYYRDTYAPNWRWEVRTPFEDSRAAAQAAGAGDAGAYAIHALNQQLQHDDFPVYLAAEWGQTDRLLSMYQQASDQLDRQRTILQLLGGLPSKETLTVLQNAAATPELADTALLALGQQGEPAIPVLVSFLESSTNDTHRLAAIRGLGVIATHNKHPLLFQQFITLLNSEDPKVQTEAVKGLGNLGDRQAITPLKQLNLQAWTNPSSHPDMQALREMLSWSLWQLSPDAHTSD